MVSDFPGLLQAKSRLLKAIILIEKLFPNIRPKFRFKNNKDIMQLKFFIVLYVNSLERRKYVSV
jgi:hypothetical protein